MTSHDNMTDTKRLMGLLPIFVGARVRVVDRLLPPTETNPIGIVPDTPGTVEEIRSAPIGTRHFEPSIGGMRWLRGPGAAPPCGSCENRQVRHHVPPTGQCRPSPAWSYCSRADPESLAVQRCRGPGRAWSESPHHIGGQVSSAAGACAAPNLAHNPRNDREPRSRSPLETASAFARR